MINKLSKKAAIRTVAFTVAIILIVGGSAISGYALVSRYKNTIEYTYQRALSDLSNYVSNLQSSLTKGLYSGTSTVQTEVSNNLISSAEGAKSALGQLPISESDANNLQKYLSQVSDIATFLNGKLAHGSQLSRDNLDLLKELSKYADIIAPQIEQLSAIYNDSNNPISTNIDLKGNLENATKALDNINLSSGFKDMNKGFTSYPSLVYDGPFADHIQQKTPTLTKDKEELTKNECKVICSRFLNVSEEDIKYDSSRKGNMPVYNYKVGNTFISVTTNGGYVEELYSTNTVTNKNLTFEQARIKAADFLMAHKIYNMKESYYATIGNVCTINFAYTQDDVICYSDLIKVGVSLDTGEIVSYNASGYIMNHKERKIESPSLTPDNAQASLSSALTVEKVSISLIPQGGESEILCYEYTCKGKGDDRVLVYINCETGTEEQLLILLQWDGGTLVM